MKLLPKKDVKKFARLYLDILEIMCEVYNLRGEWVANEDWAVEELKPELALINHLFIDPPFSDTLDAVRLGKESKGALLELIRVNPKFLYSKKYRKKFLKRLKGC
jgi:hypothetical protein